MLDKREKEKLNQKISQMYDLGKHQKIRRFIDSLTPEKQMIMEEFYKYGKTIENIASSHHMDYVRVINFRLRTLEDLKKYLLISNKYETYSSQIKKDDESSATILNDWEKDYSWLQSKWIDADLYNYYYKQSKDEIVTDAVYQLSKNQREILKRYYGQNNNLREIAEQLGDSYQAVLACYGRAKKKLIDILYPVFVTKTTKENDTTIVKHQPDIKERISEDRKRELALIAQKKNLESHLKNMFAGIKGYDQLKQDFDSLDQMSQELLTETYSAGHSILQFAAKNRIRMHDVFTMKERVLTALLEKVQNRKIDLIVDKIKRDIENIATIRGIEEITVWQKVADEIQEENEIINKVIELE